MTGTTSKIATETPVVQTPAAGREPEPTELDFRAMHARIGALLDKQIFFVGGAVKSGTTWLQALLDAHPQVSCSGENHFVNSLAPTLKSALEEHNRRLLDPRGNTARQLGKEPVPFGVDEFRYVSVSAVLAMLLKQAGDKPVLAVGDKTTLNVTAFGRLTASIARSKCIHIARDPRDGAVSGWHHITRLFPDESKTAFPAMFDYAKHYADVWAVQVGRGIEFGAQSPERCLEIRYEDLSDRPAPILAAVFRFLGVADDATLVQRCIDAASFERLSGGRARGQENPGSFFRKGVVGDWKSRLDPASREYIVATCGDLMRHFGYL